MPKADPIPAPSNPIGRYPGHAPSATARPKLLNRLREALHSRNSFATHLLEGGYDIRTVQELLGHNDVMGRIKLSCKNRQLGFPC